MDPLNPLTPIQPAIPPMTNALRVPRVERDEQRDPARDDQRPPQDDEDETLDEELDDSYAMPASGHSDTSPATPLPQLAEHAGQPDPPWNPGPRSDRRVSYDLAEDPDDESPGPHIDITA